MPTFSPIEASFEHRLNQCWFSIMVADITQLNARHGWKTVSRDVRASAAVFSIAEFEGLLKDCIEVAHEAIEASGYPVGSLRDGIRMLHLDSRFPAASGPASDATWAARHDVADSHNLAAAPTLPRRNHAGDMQPIGNQTPRPGTVLRVWRVYDLPGQPFPQLPWHGALGELADIRTDVAHRRMPLGSAMAGKARTADSIAKAVAQLRELGSHVTKTFEQYIAGIGYVA